MKIVAGFFTLLSVLKLCIGETHVSYLEPDCGVSVSGSSTKSSRIINGRVADIFGNPWMALISGGIMCGGSLITNRFVLSAAHCRSYSPTMVYLGEFDRSTITDCSTKACMPNAIGVQVDAQIAHPNYVHFSQNDIALFRLVTPVHYTAFIKPICLLTNYNPLAHIRSLTAVGWGTTELGVASNVLRTATLTQVDRSYCSAKYRYRVDMSHICAGDYSSSTCAGDSGGPISAMLPISGVNRVVQFGIVSYGNYDCREVGVYTNVMHHIDWIANTIRQGGSQTPRVYYYMPWQSVCRHCLEMMYAKYAFLMFLLGIGKISGEESSNFLDESCQRNLGSARIVNGHEAQESTTPWMAMIVNKEGLKCGGTLITNRFVLTAAHCLLAGNLKVRLGAYHLRTEESAVVQEFEVDESYQHENYTELRHDICLLRLAKRVKFTAHIRPICLLLDPRHRNLEDMVRKFRIYGWGQTEDGDFSQTLQWTSLHLHRRAECSKFYPEVTIGREHICAGRDKSGSCTGDSGGPLTGNIQIDRDRETVIQFGIVSFGAENCTYPTVFTNVMAHLDWIVDVVRSQDKNTSKLEFISSF
ncbi:uncharacterized protein LOC108101336 [Drosophila ficusphila]|uniref:uncharacterized protein LOC108101336 n=1 Tax=Drosophila ficusphila TaxID=30025 RepID=UPI0007E6502F|nr:uncharacterized protein LOC108101336 [Drosophila ficusphila]